MYKIGDLIQLNNNILRQSGFHCDSHAVFTVIGVSARYRLYRINATQNGQNLVKTDRVSADCYVSERTIVPYE